MTGAADPADLTEEAVSKWGVKDVETWFYQVGLRGFKGGRTRRGLAGDFFV